MADPIDTSPSGHPPGYGALIWSTHPTNHLQVPGSTPQGPRYSILNSNGYGGYNHCGHISIHQIASAMTNNALNTPPETKRVQLLVSVRTSDRTQHQQYDGIKMRWGGNRNKGALKFEDGEHASGHISRVHVWCRNLFAVLGTFLLFGNMP